MWKHCKERVFIYLIVEWCSFQSEISFVQEHRVRDNSDPGPARGQRTIVMPSTDFSLVYDEVSIEMS